MKVEHELFELMLDTRGYQQKSFFRLCQNPPYYTVTGWKKSGKVPAYALVLLKNMPFTKTVTAKQLIDAGVSRAIFWNNDLSKAVPSDIFIVSTLRRAYNDFIIDKFIEFFGEKNVLAVLIKHKGKLSDKLIDSITNHIHTSLASA
ncbi:hypothetical protein [Sulfurovum mangrovi]|uniref:hypothetical protein n=1 Tax=Sulfurovum mangrovi TaxID=2893889 RepID=UPI001E2CFF92|nr:hypothetical protein [Sulfurovum mangrovi]UFH58331.1 hypothetical protein LN246_08210 [Sulfurovum mangrovi]